MTEFDDEVGSPIEEFKAFAGDSGMNRSQSEYCNVGSKTSLTNHPAKKYVFDFMRVLIMENLCMTPASKQTPIVDLLLEVRRWTSPSCFLSLMLSVVAVWGKREEVCDLGSDAVCSLLTGISRTFHKSPAEGVPVQHLGRCHGTSTGC